MNSSITQRILIFLLILLIVFFASWQDFFLADVLGELFRSPTILLIPLFLLIEIAFVSKQRAVATGAAFKKVNNFFLQFHVLYIVVTFFAILVWIFQGNPMSYLGENIIVKAIKILSYFTLLWLVFRSVYFLFLLADINGISISNIFLLLTVFYFFEIIYEVIRAPEALLFLHSSTHSMYWRVRMLTAESSWTGGIATLLFAGIWVENKKSLLCILISIAFLLLFIVTSGSKQFLGGLLLSVNIFLLFKYKWKYLLVITPILLAVIPFLISNIGNIFLLSSFSDDIENYTSTATRLLTFVVSAICMISYPLGTGGLYVPYFLGKFTAGISIIDTVYPYFNFDEIFNLGINNYAGISPKNSFGIMVVMLGIPGLILLIRLYKNLIKSVLTNRILYLLVLYFIITSFFAESFDTKPNIAVFFSLICFYDNKRKIDY